MPETYDIIGSRRFLSSLRYPSIPELPRAEEGVDVREVEHPYRIGVARAVRIPFTRWALVLGRWVDDGGDEEERIRAALRARDMDVEIEEVTSWG